MSIFNVLKTTWYLVTETGILPFTVAFGVISLVLSMFNLVRRKFRTFPKEQPYQPSEYEYPTWRAPQFPRRVNPYKYRSNNKR